MTAFEYIKETIPDELNWNILSQLFEEEGIDSEGIESYLKTTPWNTNLAIVEQLLQGDGADGLIVFTINTNNLAGMVDGYADLPKNVEMLSGGDSVHVKAESSKGNIVEFDQTIQQGDDYLSIDFGGTNVYGLTDYGTIDFYLQPTEDHEQGVELMGQTYDGERVEQWGTVVTFTITKI